MLSGLLGNHPWHAAGSRSVIPAERPACAFEKRLVGSRLARVARPCADRATRGEGSTRPGLGGSQAAMASAALGKPSHHSMVRCALLIRAATQSLV